jgi:hypothetical protein
MSLVREEQAGAALNLPEVTKQVRVEFERYEAALLAHDIDAINSFFFDSAITVRLGVAEHGYGMEAIRAYRRRAEAVPANRQLKNTVITTIGNTAASVCTEFLMPGSPMIGRQTQTWALTSTGWKIIAAHVSQVLEATLQRD